MRNVPWQYRHVREGNTKHTTTDWRESAGVVYLMRFAGTDEYKVGGSINPASRLTQLRCDEQMRRGLELTYVWSIITNGVGRLEGYWRGEWRSHKVADRRNDWFILPVVEVERFRAVSVLNYRDLPSVPAGHRAYLTPPSPGSALYGRRS